MPRDNQVLMEDVQIVFRNFGGGPTKFKPAGERTVGVLLPDEIAIAMAEDDWLVKWLNPREDGDAPKPWLPVKLEFEKGRPPNVVMITSGGRTHLNASTIECLDYADILKVDLIVTPYDWTMSDGKSGRKAYLKSMYVTIDEDELERKYSIAGEPSAE